MKKLILSILLLIGSIVNAETIANQLTTLNTIKSNIKTAIESKGVSVGSASFNDYDTKISSIAAGESVSLVEKVQWPADAAVAHLNPAASVNGTVTNMVSFQHNSIVVVVGPTHVTLEYGTPEEPPISE